ncbi:hypothetical protein ACFZCT_36405 [Streptomyces qaidamensis]|uniref:hypothetical protein n=1 Tax=Streptomyces qaidamensis TaxID=1783515 RepID=UPI0036E5C2DA
MRLQTINGNGTLKSWSWHEIYGGKGDGGAWNTYADDANLITQARVQVAVMEGDAIVRSCVGPWRNY